MRQGTGTSVRVSLQASDGGLPKFRMRRADDGTAVLTNDGVDQPSTTLERNEKLKH